MNNLMEILDLSEGSVTTCFTCFQRREYVECTIFSSVSFIRSIYGVLLSKISLLVSTIILQSKTVRSGHVQNGTKTDTDERPISISEHQDTRTVRRKMFLTGQPVSVGFTGFHKDVIKTTPVL